MNGPLGHVKKVQNDFNKEVPLSIIGHSMGGLITVHAAMAEPDLFKCIVLMGPLITMDPTLVTPFKKVLAGVFSGLLPSLALGQEIAVSELYWSSQNYSDLLSFDDFLGDGKNSGRFLL